MTKTLRQRGFFTFRCLHRAVVWCLPKYRAPWRALWDFVRDWPRQQWQDRVWPKFAPPLSPEDQLCPARPASVAATRWELAARPNREFAATQGIPEASYDQLAALRARAWSRLLHRLSDYECELACREGVRITGQLHGLRSLPDPIAPGYREQAGEVIELQPHSSAMSVR